MLWRISGNGLTKPSYLFGTIHVQDKRLFNFTDSLYHFIQQAEGFALEVDFKDYMDSLINRTIVSRQREWLAENDEEKVVDTRAIGKEADTLLRELGMDRKTLTPKQLKKVREYRLSRLATDGEMPTIIDAYLFGIALRQGKWTGGIEDVTDQMDVMDEVGQSINPKEIFAPEQELRFSLEQMKQTYLKEDLQRISDVSYANNRDPFTQRMLIQRNVKMARRMDSLTRFRSMFFAVGAAHLPSDSGVIALLRRRGYRVEPVFSSKRIAAESIAAKLDEIAWMPVQDEEKLFTVQMPGQPSAFSVFGDVVKMNMFFDITTMTFYMAGSTLAEARSARDLSTMVSTIAGQNSVMGTVKSRKDISTPEMNGVEALIESGEGVFRIRLLQKDRVLYMLMAGSNKKMNLGSSVDRFFRSFVAHAPTAKSWTDLTLASKGVRISFPGTPKRNAMLESAGNSSNWTFTAYDHMDVANGIYFLFHVRETGPSFNLDGDSVYFEAFEKQLGEKYDSVLRREVSTYQGYPAFHLWMTSSKNKLVYRTLSVVRGNRVYVLMVGMTANSEIPVADRFLHSLQLSDYPQGQWKLQTSVAGGFRAMANEPFREVQDKNDDADDETAKRHAADPFRRRHFLAYDSLQVLSMDVFRTPLSPFFWSKNDSTFFADHSAQYYSSFTDTVHFNGPVMVGGLKG